MRRLSFVAALLLAPAAAAAQDMYGTGMTSSTPKKTSFQVTGGIMFPAFSGYPNYVDDIGWNAGAAFILTPRRGTHVRLEGEYNSIGSEIGSTTASVYGGGIGGGRAITSGGSTTEGYFVAGLYNAEVCLQNLTGGCDISSELQFGTKIGFGAVVGRGKVRPVFSMYWLYTWSSPYVSIIPITVGLRF